MQSDIRLFIGGKEVFFSQDPKILFNYKETELRNPTIIKNGWSKTVEIPGSEENNDVFSHIWSLERVQGAGSFNAMQKTPFQLFFNGSLVEKGYAKLDNIKKIGQEVITYSVTLYGSIGDFFYSLSYDQGADSDVKKTLADLTYVSEDEPVEPNLDFTINKETIAEAWNFLGCGGEYIPDDKWGYINFAPCYNGIPQDFDANKVLLAGNSFTGFFPGYSASTYDNGNEYYSILNGNKNYSGYAIAETSEELTCDETLDLRSYLQRPVVNVRRTLEACFHPSNNGGYQVKLDSHFFNVDNPYWYRSWMTLPMLKDLGVQQGQTEVVSGATLNRTDNNVWDIVYSGATLSNISNCKMRLRINFDPISATTANTLWTTTNLSVKTGMHIFEGNRYVKKYLSTCGVMVQMWALGTNGDIVATSDAYLLGGDRNQANSSEPLWEDFYKGEGDGIAPTRYNFVQGKWIKSGSTYTFADLNNNPVSIEFTLNTDVEYSRLQLKICTPWSDYAKYAYRGNDYDYVCYGPGRSALYTTTADTTSGDLTLGYARDVNRVLGYFDYVITDFYLKTVDLEAFFSGTEIPKRKLLSTSFSPGEFLISYCKLFGLYFYRDPAEEADDPYSAPNGVIHIMDRGTFYDGEIIDLEKIIDRGSQIVISPTNAGSKWYSFKNEPIDSEANTDYKETYGYDYGRQLVNTGYNFDSDTTDLYDSNIFKSGVMVREKDKYFAEPIGGVPYYPMNGLTYTLFRKGEDEYEGHEVRIEPKTISVNRCMNYLGLKHYDMMPKLQCHSKGNDASDGAGVLLFYNGPINSKGEDGAWVWYWLTDDVADMQYLNDGQPCWLLIGNEYIGNQRVAIKKELIPHFTRDLIVNGGQEGNIVHSWNFGHPQVTFSPNTYTTEGDSIYDKWWKNYINDLYSVDGRKVSCKVLLKGCPNPTWMRKFFFFDNSIWRLNEIKDWNICGLETTQCEFIKVNDVNNYKIADINDEGFEAISVEPETVPYSGGVVTVTIRQQGGGWWYMDDNMIPGTDTQGNDFTLYGAASKTSGSGNTDTFTITFPQSPSGYPITWRIGVEDENDNWLWTSVLQEGQGDVPYIRIVETGVTVPATGGTSAVTYEYHNIITSSITFSFDQSWVTGSMDTTAKTITFTAQGNEGAVTRTANIGISGRDETHHVLYSDTCEITQPAFGGFALEGSPITFSYEEDVWTDKAILKVVADSGTTWTITDFNDV